MNAQNDTLEEVLLATPWVQQLTPPAKERVLSESYDQTYEPRDLVGRRGDISRSWLGVVDGLIKVSTVVANGRGMMFTAVPRGSWVGEGTVIKREPRRYDLIAIRPTRVIHLPRATFMWLLETSPEFSRVVIDHLNERSGQFLAMLEVSRVAEPIGRVAGAICNLFNPILYSKASQLLNMSQEELGELAGLSRSTTNIALAKLKKLNLVIPEYGGLFVVDLDRLKAFYESVSVSAESVHHLNVDPSAHELGVTVSLKPSIQDVVKV
jgi:CRP/FNR family cyclic AMP-dependent transcriptional regulator